jgi:hypothetical protein
VSLQSLFEAYHDEIQFLMIYIREAHPVDGWWFGHGLVSRMIRFYSPLTSFHIHDPKTIEERRTAAKQCQGALQFGIKTYVDDMEDSVSKAYAAKPTRLYLVGLDGRVAYAGGPGPYGFKPGELKKAIDLELQ